MRCSKCGREGIAGKRFCAECGIPLSRRCSKCNSDNAADAKFCADCGAALGAPVSPVAETPPVRAPEVGGERRHLTILFCDLVGSVTLAAQLDPEEWRATVAGYQRAASEAITRLGGEVVRYVGDGIMAFFGYPVAHDNDAERAARAGLAILDAIAQLNQRPGYTKLAVRIGIDSGRVVVSAGAGGGQAVDAFGDAANIAARVQAAAEPGTLMISDATQRLVAGLFVVEDRGAQALKGIEGPVQLYRVVRPSGMRGRFEVMAAAGGLTPFVGREDELRSLLNRWERVLEGEGQVVTIIGEAGIGKSRLVQRFHQQIGGSPHTWIEAGTGTFFQNTPFHPISEMLQHLIVDAAALDQIAMLASRLTAAGLAPAEAIPLLAPLLNLALPPEYPPSPLSPEQQRRRLLATLVEWMLGSTHAQPLVIATEDLHWVDPSTLELIQLLVEQGATARLLLLYTARPEFHPPWTMRAHHTQITLNRLSARDARTIVGEVAAQGALSDETITTVVERTGGVPLFVEELTRVVLESGDGKLTSSAIPATLHDSLMARLDRLGPAKEVIQVSAVIGSEFSYELLHAVHPMAEVDLQRALRALTDAELLYVRGLAPKATYQFKHALIRDAAYDALLKSRRKELHLTVARTIDEQFPAFKEAHPDVLARHWTEAGEADAAVTEWQRAGERAVAVGSTFEAALHYAAALELLTRLPEARERDHRELALQMALGGALIAIKGWAAPDVELAFTRAQQLCERLGDSVELFHTVFGLYALYFLRSELRKASEIAVQMRSRAQITNDSTLLLLAHQALGQTSFQLGEQLLAKANLEKAISLYDRDRHRSLALALGADVGVVCVSYAAWTLWVLGYPEQALRRGREALALARELSHHHTLAFALWFFGLLRQYRREVHEAQQAADEMLALSAEHGFTAQYALGTILRGGVIGEQGRVEEAIALIREGMAATRATGTELGRPYYLYLLARAYMEDNRVGDALGALTEALAAVDQYEDRNYEAEINRLVGELLLRQENPVGAGRRFQRAIEIARHQSAKSWELRATTSLARLLATQGRRDEARAMLTEIYNWFTEGFDTADLKDAKALLEELA